MVADRLDVNTGCTPIVLAIRSGHVDVVRELLAAGAIVPPPGLTNDPTILALLYGPQAMYGMPPPPFNGAMMGGQEFYPQQAFYPGGPGHERFMQSFPRKDGSPNGSSLPSNLPPAEVSKTIPCRNFPNCKYGSSCVFFHPSAPAFYPPPQQRGPMPNGFMPGFDGSFPPSFQPGAPYFVPNNGFNSFPPPPQEHSPLPPQESQELPATGDSEVPTSASQTLDTPTSPAPIPSAHAPSAIAPVFVPQYAPSHLASPPPPSQFGLSPMSPSMLAGSLPSIPPAEVFFAQSPPNGTFPPNGFPANRRQSFGQGYMNGVPGKPYQGKKPSFSGGPRPFRNGASSGGTNLGSWKDGNPPPCAFFVQAKCRNGEYCKFPHLDEQGNDVRHPDVVKGLIAPVPSMRPSRGRVSNGQNGFVPFDPSFRGQQGGYAGQPQYQNGFTQPPAIPEGEVAATAEEAAPATTEAIEGGKPALPASVPAKPATNLNATSAAPLPQIVRSASQPGVQRVHVNGFNSRSHSPAPSNVSFHGNGHPRRAGRVPFPNGQRTASNGNAENRSQSQSQAAQSRQRVPGADDFPALAGSTSPTLNTTEKWDGKTAAQVLSAPAPAPAPAPAKDNLTESAVDITADAQSVKSEQVRSYTCCIICANGQSLSMEDESDSDVVIISHKPSPAPTPSHAASAAPRAPISFAKVISAATPAAPESTAIGVEA